MPEGSRGQEPVVVDHSQQGHRQDQIAPHCARPELMHTIKIIPEPLLATVQVQYK